MVVVFQTIEITRLSEEIETLRVALVDCERQINNYLNYEIQIRELNDKVCEYENERASYQEEMEKMNIICQQLYADLEKEKDISEHNTESVALLRQEHTKEQEKSSKLEAELQKWKNRHTALEKSKQSELEEIKLSMENQRKSTLNKELNELQTKYNTERQSLEKEIYQLREILNQEKETKRVIKTELTKKEVEIENLSLLKDQVKEYENRFTQIENEFIKLNDLLRKKEEQQQKYREEEKRLTSKLREYEKIVQKEYLPKISLIESLENTMKEQKEKCISLEMEIEGLQESQKKTSKLEQLLAESTNEVERLKQIIKDKLKYIEGWQEKYSVLETKYKSLEQSNDNVYGELENKLLEKEKELTIITIQAKERLEELETIRRKYEKLQNNQSNSAEKYKKENEVIKGQNDEYKTKVKEIEGRLTSLMKDNNMLRIKETELMKYKNELEPQYKRQLIQLTKTIEQKTQELELLNNRLSRTSSESSNHKESLINELEQLNKKYNQITIYSDELQNTIKEKVKEIKLLKEALTKIDQKLSQFQSIEKKLASNIMEKEKMLKDMEELREENNELFDNNLELKNKLTNCDKDMFEKVEEMTILANQLKFLEEEKSIIKQETEQLSQELKQSFERERQLMVRIKEIEEINGEMEGKIKGMNHELMKTAKGNMEELDEHKSEVQKLKDELMRSKQKYEKLEQSLHAMKLELKKQESERDIERRDYELTISQLKSEQQKLLLESDRNMAIIESQLKNELDFNKNSLTKNKEINLSLEMKLKEYVQVANKHEQKIKKLSETIEELTQKLKQYQNVEQNLESKLKDKAYEIEDMVRKMKEKEETEAKEKKTTQNIIETKNQEYFTLKKHYENEKKKHVEENIIRDEEKKKLVRQLEETQSRMNKLNEELNKALTEGRNSKEFIEQFNSIKIQSESIDEFLADIIQRYLTSKDEPKSQTHIISMFVIEQQIKALKQITQSTIKICTETATKYEEKLNHLILEKEKHLKEYNELEEQHIRLKDMLITLESKNKLLQYELDQQHIIVKQQKIKEAPGSEPSLVQIKESSFINYKEPSLISEKEPFFINEREPFYAAEKKTFEINEKEPSYISQKRPSYITEKEPSYISEKRSSYHVQRSPSQTLNNEPFYNASKEPSYIEEKSPSYITEKSVSEISDKFQATTEKEPSKITNRQPSSIVMKRESAGSSLIESRSESKITQMQMKKVREKKNISTLFKSMANSDSIIEPLCSNNSNGKDNNSQLNEIAQVPRNNMPDLVGERETPSKLLHSKSMGTPEFTATTTMTTATIAKNNTTNNTNTMNTSPLSSKVNTDMIESTVFELPGDNNPKTSQMFKRLSNNNQSES